jgi:hypothetical protein
VNYTDSENRLARYIYSQNNNSECWMPILIGSKLKASPWLLRFAVPKEYMVISSGVHT